MKRVKVRDLIYAGWEKGAGGAWYLETKDDPQTHLHLGASGGGGTIVVKFVSIKSKDQYHAHYYNGGHALDRGSIEDLPETSRPCFGSGSTASDSAEAGSIGLGWRSVIMNEALRDHRVCAASLELAH